MATRSLGHCLHGKVGAGVVWDHGGSSPDGKRGPAQVVGVLPGDTRMTRLPGFQPRAAFVFQQSFCAPEIMGRSPVGQFESVLVR